MKEDKRISYTIRPKPDLTDSIIIRSTYKSGKIEEKKYRKVENSSICEMVKEGAVNLDNCYIKDFSYKAIEKNCGRGVVLNNFSAINAFFDGTVDFSGAEFGEGKVDFLRAEFSGAVDFVNAKFRDGDVSFCDVEFSRTVDFSYATFGEGEVCFLRAQFSGAVNFNYTTFGEGDVCFWAAKFSGAVDFSYATFGKGEVGFLRAQFSGAVDFVNAKFRDGDVCFRDAKFGKDKVSFARANFGEGDVCFWDAKFSGAVDFRNAKFGKGEVDFREAKFHGAVNFNYTTFGEGEVCFHAAKFHGDVEFLFVSFGEGEVNFHAAKFGKGEVNFHGSRAIEATVCFKGCIFANHDNLRFQNIKKLEILDCTIEKTMRLDSTENIKVNIGELSFQDTRNLGAIYIDWDTAKKAIKNYGEDSSQESKSNQIELLKEDSNRIKEYYREIKHVVKKYFFYIVDWLRAFWKVSSKESKANQMKLLKENFNRIQEYDCEDEAFVEYMRYNRKTKSKLEKSGLYLLDWIGAYGTSPLRVAGSMVVAILFFTFLYSNWISCTNIDVKVSENSLFESIYFSVITFLTIGYGDLSPKNEITAAVAAVEGFVGLFLMSYFVVALVRKTLR